MSDNSGILVTTDGKRIEVGDSITSFRGEVWEVTGWHQPQHPGSTGRIYVKRDGHTGEYYPGVFNAKIVPTQAS